MTSNHSGGIEVRIFLSSLSVLVTSLSIHFPVGWEAFWDRRQRWTMQETSSSCAVGRVPVFSIRGCRRYDSHSWSRSIVGWLPSPSRILIRGIVDVRPSTGRVLT